MNRMQKMSWWMVATMGSGLLLSIIAVTASYFMVGFPKAWSGIAFIGIGGLGGLGPLIFKKDPGPVHGDERDQFINLKAARASFALSYLLFGLLSMGIWSYYHYHNQSAITIEVLPLVWGLAAVTAFLSHAVMILVLYGKDNQPAKGGAA